MAENTYRINKVASELNVSFQTLLERLNQKGFDVEVKPTTKISEEMYALLQAEFKSDKAAKDESKSLKLTVTKEAPKVVEQKEVKKTVEDLPKEEEEEDNVWVKNTVLSDIPTPPPAPVENTEPPVTKEEPKEIVQEPEIVPVKEEITVAPPSFGTKVVGKINLDEINNKTRPDKKKKAEPIKEETPKKEEAPEIVNTPAEVEEIIPVVEVKTNQEEVPIVEPKDDVKKPIVEEITPEVTPEVVAPPIVAPEPEDTTIKPQYEVLPGLKIKGKIELKAEPSGNKSKNQILKEYSADNANKKKKRTRKVVEKVKIDEVIKNKKPGTGGGYNHNNNNNNRPGADKPKAAITEKEIQDRLKATLSRIDSSGRGKNTKSKLKKQKRDVHESNRNREREQQEQELKVLKVTEFVSANELAGLMDVSVNEIITVCFSMGLMVSINQRLDAETITIVADEFGYDVEFIDAESQVAFVDIPDDPKDLVHRAPIVTVMGHVDHGKTSLLDRIRSTNVIAGEAGGITQHIGAYEVTLEGGQKITFLDTPGHEAFTAMRARGAKVTDIAVIVIAADDSVMPQTREAISHAQAAGVPMIFAINKIDKPGANPDKIREALSQMNILVEDWGGKFQCQEIAAKHGLNVDKLLEKILLEAELLELTANPNRNAKGTIVEAKIDKGRGIVASLLVQNGTLKVGDHVVAGPWYGKVKALYNERFSRIEVAGPSTPVGMLGFSGAPTAGDPFVVFETEHEAKELANRRFQLQREQGIRSSKHITLDEIGRRLAVGNFKELNLIVKGDVDGSVEALSDSLLKLSTEEIQINVIHKGVGQITESDVLLASASDAIIVGFQVRPAASAKKLAENEQIDIRTYSIIYKAIEEVKSAMEGMLSPDVVEKIVGNVEVREVFKISKVGTIAGCMVTDGKIERKSNIRVIRDGVVIHTGRLASLKRFKDDVKEVSKGYDCGMHLEKFNDLQEGDNIEAFTEEEVKRKLK